jgi:chromate reductase
MSRILGLCGSLRVASKNRLALEVARDVAPAGIRLVLWTGLASLPPFSPDLDQPGTPLPDAVAAFHADVAASDALLIACPEYAHGIPGAFKNALDWLVGSAVFPGKPVALLNVAPHAQHAQAQLREVLVTMSARIVEPACLEVNFDVFASQPAAGRCAIENSLSALAGARDD